MVAGPGGYYYPAAPAQPMATYGLTPSSVAAPTFVPSAAQAGYGVPLAPTTVGGQASGTMAQESNGMVYYYDSSQLAPPPPQPPAPAPSNGYPIGGYAAAPHNVELGVGHMVTPSPDGYYYPMTAPGPVYYGQ
jgi:hypothetical protein